LLVFTLQVDFLVTGGPLAAKIIEKHIYRIPVFGDGRNRAGSFLLECIPSPPSEASLPSFLIQVFPDKRTFKYQPLLICARFLWGKK